MPEGSSAVSLTYLASEKVVPGYGGGMSSAKAQLESDTKVADPPALREAPLPLTPVARSGIIISRLFLKASSYSLLGLGLVHTS